MILGGNYAAGIEPWVIRHVEDSDAHLLRAMARMEQMDRLRQEAARLKS